MKVNGYDIRPSADLRDANLREADLHGAHLREADLRGADLRGANLIGADLRDANLHSSDLSEADLRDANLRWADLHEADLRDANLRGARLPDFQIPQEGELIVYKTLASSKIAKLRIPPEAKRTASLVGRTCRAEFAEVLDGNGVSEYCNAINYTTGKTVRPDKYDPDIRIECTHGIHFFLTREEAEDY